MLRSKGIVTDLQKRILEVFSATADSRCFYLGGGTALADFYLAHRKSFDLDMFTAEEGLVLPFSRVLERALKGDFNVKVVRRLESFVEYEIGMKGEETRLQLAYDSPFRFANPVDSDLGVKVNDYEDLVTDKLLAFYGRVEPRDAVDLFFILESEDIWKLSRAAAKKDPGFDLYWMAVALGKTREFPDEISRWPVRMLRELDARVLKERLQKLAEKILEEIKKDRPGNGAQMA